jgi:hypothetical protein
LRAAAPDESFQVPLYLADPCGETLEVGFLTRRHLEVGTVTVGNDQELLRVTIDMGETGWVLAQSHLVVRETHGRALRPKAGRLGGGRSQFSGQHDPPVTLWNYDINLAEYGFEPGDLLRISVRGVVQLADGDPHEQERAWAVGLGTPGPSWATFFRYVVQACEDPAPCTITVTYPNGGEFLCAGWEEEIQWDGSLCGSTVMIELLRDDRVCSTIEEAAENTGTYEWLVAPCHWETEGYKIRVTDLESGASDDSDAPFTIAECW